MLFIKNIMRVTDFSFDLPKKLIARYPKPERSACRLLSLDGATGKIKHQVFRDLLKIIDPGDLLVFNNTRVIPARLFGHKASGGKIEVLVERVLSNKCAFAHIRNSNALKVGSTLLLGDNNNIRAIVTGLHNEFFELYFDDPRDVLTILNDAGHIPLPPYLDRPDDAVDQELYQTVYNKHPGSIAAPTAGLHFDEPLLAALRTKKIEMVFITLHVGAGTFQLVRVDKIKQHIIHPEYVEVPQKVVEAVRSCKERGKRVIAVGTTSVRSLETAATKDKSTLAPFFGDTRIFIVPGYHFRVTDALITNFHLPKSTLIMLVAAFAGYHYTLNSYRQAILQGYHFFSYGDAMFITRNPAAAEQIVWKQ